MAEFQVQAGALETRAAVVAQRQPMCASLAEEWAAAAQRVVTGETGLDRSTAEVAAAGRRLGQVYGQVLAALGGRMTDAAANYRAGDADAAAVFRSIEELLARPAATGATS